MLGGKGERERAECLMRRVRVLPDVAVIDDDNDDDEHNQPEQTNATDAGALAGLLDRLTFGGKIKTRSVRIFAFGLAHRALTVTANEGFIRSARMQGVHIPAFVHGARPLSEQKEARARRLAAPTTATAVTVDTSRVNGSVTKTAVELVDTNANAEVM